MQWSTLFWMFQLINGYIFTYICRLLCNNDGVGALQACKIKCNLFDTVYLRAHLYGQILTIIFIFRVYSQKEPWTD